MSNGFIKLHRELIKWEWFDDSKTLHVFLTILLNANHEDGKWHGNIVKRGQWITGRKKLSKLTGISEQSIRTILQRLESTGELTSRSTNKFTLITVVNWDTYQLTQKESNQPNANKQPTTNQQLTTNKNEKKKDFLFDTFWDVFGDKKGRAGALRSWRKINPSDGLFLKIIEGAEKYAVERKNILARNGVPKMAQGWLTDRRWEDEDVETETNLTPQQKQMKNKGYIN